MTAIDKSFTTPLMAKHIDIVALNVMVKIPHLSTHYRQAHDRCYASFENVTMVVIKNFTIVRIKANDPGWWIVAYSHGKIC
ncbi:hypothetical protein MHB50_02415 [Siminovitchia sp. FSL H7-0308]|uniref:Uncharacterized protein n=1 Tax=Siminovitchia thermophila TaxID=1245522 RepID=A0ABS2R3T1_9BACI|nr:hypothetical protein [Siminovitchia thermophila]MBM7713824.1 hypothetical protein [Siminovitchia thermophila]